MKSNMEKNKKGFGKSIKITGPSSLKEDLDFLEKWYDEHFDDEGWDNTGEYYLDPMYCLILYRWLVNFWDGQLIIKPEDEQFGPFKTLKNLNFFKEIGLECNYV